MPKVNGVALSILKPMYCIPMCYNVFINLSTLWCNCSSGGITPIAKTYNTNFCLSRHECGNTFYEDHTVCIMTCYNAFLKHYTHWCNCLSGVITSIDNTCDTILCLSRSQVTLSRQTISIMMCYNVFVKLLTHWSKACSSRGITSISNTHDTIHLVFLVTLLYV